MLIVGSQFESTELCMFPLEAPLSIQNRFHKLNFISYSILKHSSFLKRIFCIFVNMAFEQSI